MSLIAGIEGRLEAKTDEAVLVHVAGVTFQIAVSTNDLATLPEVGNVVRLLTHLIVREDDLQLFGFSNPRGKTMFEAMLSVSGVGPKAALAILSALSVDEVTIAVLSGDATALSKAQGVGKRTAERIILDLKGKFEDTGISPVVISGTTSITPHTHDPALVALLGLGFSTLEARQALSLETDDSLDIDERVHRALQRMGVANG